MMETPSAIQNLLSNLLHPVQVYNVSCVATTTVVRRAYDNIKRHLSPHIL